MGLYDDLKKPSPLRTLLFFAAGQAIGEAQHRANVDAQNEAHRSYQQKLEDRLRIKEDLFAAKIRLSYGDEQAERIMVEVQAKMLEFRDRHPQATPQDLAEKFVRVARPHMSPKDRRSLNSRLEG